MSKPIEDREGFIKVLTETWRREKVIVIGDDIIIGETQYRAPGAGSAAYHVDSLLAWIDGKK